MKETLQLGYCENCNHATCLDTKSKCVDCHKEMPNDMRGLF